MSSQSSCVSRAQCSGKLQLNSVHSGDLTTLDLAPQRMGIIWSPAILQFPALHMMRRQFYQSELVCIQTNSKIFKQIQRYSKILARIRTAKNCLRKFINSADEINLRQLHTMRKLSHLTLTVWQIYSCNFPSCQVDQHQHQLKHQNTNTSSNIKSGPTPTPTQKYH